MRTDNVIQLDIGDVARLVATFTDPDTAAAVDPDAVFFRWVTPDGAVETLQYGTDDEVTRISAGVYRCYLECAKSGRYSVRTWSTGNGQAAELGAVAVRRDTTEVAS